MTGFSIFRSDPSPIDTFRVDRNRSDFESSLIGAFLSTVLFGFYISVAIRCSFILWNRSKSKRKLNSYLLFTHAALVILVTIRCITTIVRVMIPAHKETYIESFLWTPDSLLVNNWAVSKIGGIGGIKAIIAKEFGYGTGLVRGPLREVNLGVVVQSETGSKWWKAVEEVLEIERSL
ncbi:hypothetical protein BT96DRAFT_1006605 [Gymnopus androsaceus JB14]|uniref:Uncharacterized protein n=1 Tax=Gymnopus androsaceus JB14 TaxID=1447944 RepID=A0A6A4GJW1_9AGAR|nr:hypothetical protein BT96DRAFT_1006605 [Gymnopus androsaceus JB14]